MISIDYKIVEGSDEETEGLLHDTIAAMYNLWYSSSSLLSPIIGGFLFDQVGYRNTMNITMALIFLTTGGFFYFNCGFKVYEKTRIEMAEVNRLKDMKYKL